MKAAGQLRFRKSLLFCCRRKDDAFAAAWEDAIRPAGSESFIKAAVHGGLHTAWAGSNSVGMNRLLKKMVGKEKEKTQ